MRSNGGNDALNNFLKQYNVITSSISEKYNSPPAMLYRER
jgi:hypothetical protein